MSVPHDPAGDPTAALRAAFPPAQAEALAALFRGLRAELEALRGALLSSPPRAASSPAPASIPAPSPEVPADHLMVIAAAVAAFLGDHAWVRAVRPLPTTSPSPWAQQGRVFVQASHNLDRRR